MLTIRTELKKSGFGINCESSTGLPRDSAVNTEGIEHFARVLPDMMSGQSWHPILQGVNYFILGNVVPWCFFQRSHIVGGTTVNDT